MRALAGAAGLLLALHAAVAGACGHCVEDKVAAVYDYATVTKAKAARHAMAFFAIEGRLVPDESLRQAIASMARATDGVDKESVRVSLDLAALSFSFDPRRTSLGTVRKSITRKMAFKKLGLTELNFVDKPNRLLSKPG
jgi:hypothetical protein